MNNANIKRLWMVGGLVAILVIILYIVHQRSLQTPALARPALAVATAKVGTFYERVSAHGRVGPPPGSSAALAFPVAGRIQSIDVHVGDRVAAGQPLAQLDTAGFVNAVQQARGDLAAAAGGFGQGTAAALRSAEAKLAVAKLNLERTRNGDSIARSDKAGADALARQADLKVQTDTQALARTRALFGAGIVAAKDLQAAQSQLDADRAEARSAHTRALSAAAGARGSLTQASADYAQAQADVMMARGQGIKTQASLAEAERNLANATLRAPSDGVVVAILKRPGESVDPTTPAIALGALYQYAATLGVPGAQANRIHVGDRVDLKVPRSAESASGRVIAVVPAVDPTTQQAVVVVSGVPKDAVAGDAVEASIVIGKQTGILVPTSAIVQDPQSGNTLVFVEQQKDGNQSFSQRKVQVGPGDQSATQIRSGLRAGERVAAEGAFELLAPAPNV